MNITYKEELLKHNIVCIDGFLSSETCRAILKELKFSYWQDSIVIQKNQANQYTDTVDACRVSQTSFQQWFSGDLNHIITAIENKINDLFGIPTSHCESWQATKYEVNGKFDYHVDASYWKNTPEGERTKTLLLYLDTPAKGGSTHFRALNKEFEAKAGRLLVWNNTFENGNCNFGMIHSGTPLIEGRKTTLVTWVRQRDFRKLNN